MKSSTIALTALAAAVSIISSCGSSEQHSIKDIYTEFKSAPDSTRTKVWWFHGETETTFEGITADLEAFKEAGVGGVIYYDQIHGDGKGASAIFSREWWDALIFSAQEAKRLGLSFEISLSNGFVAGGPWITKEMSMKRLCNSQIVLDGGQRYNDYLPEPSSDEFWDVKVLAFPVPSATEWESRVLIDKTQKYQSNTILTYDMGEPFTARSLSYSEYGTSKPETLAMNWPGDPADEFYGDGFVKLPPIGQLEVSDDGVNYRVVRDLPALYNIHHKIKTVSFPAVTARYYRLNLHDWNRPDGQRARTLEMRSATLNSQAMTDGWENRAGINSEYVSASTTPPFAEGEVIPAASIIDISDKMDADGKLDWQAPDGDKKWVVLRVAQHSTRGHTKHGRPGQMGLECDKLSKEAAKLQWDNFAQVLIDTLGKHDLKPIGVLMDSHEMGSQNWTHGYDKEFRAYKGYDITPYLPALLGYIVDSVEKSDEVLFHHRQTLAHLVNHRYFGALDTLAMQQGVMLTAQAMGNGQSMTCDNISAKGAVRRPQGEFWGKHDISCYDIKEAASAAHIYGKPIASAEAFTDVKYSQKLSYFKTLADYAFAYQLNEFMVCASAYQPWLDRRPGNTANKREYCLNRNNTMWPLSRGFWDYQSRCAFLMRQGEPVVDLCIYLGSDVANKILSYRLPVIPEGYDWDVCTDPALLGEFSARKGRLQARSGMSYAAIVVERLATLSPEAEAKIAELEAAGVPVYDARKLGDYGLKAFLDDKGITPDAAFTSQNKVDDRLFFTHRKTSDADIYFFDNHSDYRRDYSIKFRNSRGKSAQWWNPDNGQSLTLQTRTAADGDLVIDLPMEGREAGFVILAADSSLPQAELARTWGMAEEQIKDLSRDWDVTFALRDGEKTVGMPQLHCWTEFEQEELKHYSGTAVYQKEADIKAAAGKRAYLRINGLEATSRVWINGQDAGYLWCAPWEVDITEFLAEGVDEIRIEVANQLTNRMIGDLSLPEERRSTWATTPLVGPESKILPAGITGSIEIVCR